MQLADWQVFRGPGNWSCRHCFEKTGLKLPAEISKVHHTLLMTEISVASTSISLAWCDQLT
jgi:hypothetical protein